MYKIIIGKSRAFFVLFILSAEVLFSQERPVSDTSARPPVTSVSVVRPYKEVITSKAVTKYGLFKVHRIDEKYYFEIPRSLFGKQMLSVGKITQAPVDPTQLQPTEKFGIHKTGYAGQRITENVIEFTQGPRNKVFLRLNYFNEQSYDSSANGMYRAVKSNSIQPVAASYDIKAYSPDSSAVVIDATDFIGGDNPILYFSADAKKLVGLTSIMADRSYIEEVSTFPSNLEIKSVKTYKTSDAFATYQLSSNIILLPEKLMKIRTWDKRTAFNFISFQDFDVNPNGVDEVKILTKWRLEPKAGEIENYNRGELVEPVKPIVFYIDPVTPEKWIPFIRAAVLSWQPALERAGFKNAIQVKVVRRTDSSWNIGNATYSTIIFKPSAVKEEEIEFNTIHPQTGEILASNIVWSNSEMEEMYMDYFLQCSALDPKARKPRFDDELMGQLIQSALTHKIGHSLGLAHPLGASATVKVEQLRDRKYVSNNSISPSIMDELPYNYVAQPEDRLERKDLIPFVGEFDKWAIEFGYKLPSQLNSKEEQLTFWNKWIIDSLTKNPRLNRGGDLYTDPRTQANTLSNDLMKANALGIQNLKTILPEIKAWTFEPLSGNQRFASVYRGAFNQYKLYISSILPYLGGIQGEYRTNTQGGNLYEFVDKASQKQALTFLNNYFFNFPYWLLRKDYFESAGGYPSLAALSSMQESVLNIMLNNDKLYQMEVDKMHNGISAYTTSEYLQDMKNYIFSELKSRKNIDPMKRRLQKLYVNNLSDKVTPGAVQYIAPTVTISLNISYLTDASVEIKYHLKSLLAEINAVIPGVADKTTKMHLTELAERLNVTMKAIKE